MVNRIKGITIQLDGDTKPLEKALGDVNARSRDLQKELRDVDRLLKFNPGNTELLAQKQQLLGEQVENTSKKLEQLKSAEEQVQEAFRKGEIKEEQYRAFQREITETESKLKHFQGQLDQTKDKFADLSEKVNEAGQKVKSVGEGMKDAGKKMSGYLTVPLAGAAAIMLKTGMDFEASMSNVEAISGATGDELEKLEQKARELGATTSKSASEAADALGYMALAGWDTSQMMAGLEPVLRLSEAGNLDLARASDLVTDSMSAMQIEISDLPKYLDTIAEASRKSNTDIDALMGAFLVAGGNLAQLNVPLEESTALLGLLANRGLKGSEAGRALNAIMVNLTSGAGQAGKAMEELGLSAFDSEGSFIGLEETLRLVKEATAGMTDEQQAQYISMISGKEHLKSFQGLLAGLDSEYNALRENVTAADGALNEMALTMQDNAKGKIKEMQSAFEELSIQFSDYLLPAITALIIQITALINWFGGLDESSQKTILVIGGVAAAIGPLLILLGAMASGLGSVIAVISKIIPLIGSLGKALTFLAANPVGLIVTAIAGLVAGLIYLYNTNEDVKKALKAAWDFLKRAAESIFRSIQRFWNTWGSNVIAFFQTTWNFLSNLFNTVFNAIKGLVQSIFGGISEFWDEWGGKITGSFINLFEILKILFQAVFGVIALTISTIFDGIKSFWDDWGSTITILFRTVFNVLKSLFEGTWNNIKIYIETVMKVIKSLFEGTWNAIKIVIETAIDLIYNIIKLFLSVLKGDWEGAWEAIRGIVESVWNGIMKTFGNVYETMSKIGKDIIKGLVDGVKSMASAAVNAAKDVAKGIGDSVKDFFRISSPSKLMMEYGTDIGDGLAVGIQHSVNAVKQQAQALSQAAGNALQSIPTVPIPSQNIDSLAGTGGVSGGVVQNITINSPQPLSPSETARRNLQASRQLAMEWGMS